MKTAIKVLNILSIVGYAIASVVYLILGIIMLCMPIDYSLIDPMAAKAATTASGIVFLVLIVVFVGLAIFVMFAQKKFENAKSKDEVIVWAVLLLVFGNLISGILMLVYDDYSKDTSVNEEVHEPSYTNTNDNISPANQLLKLNELRQSGVITEEEFAELKKKYLEKL